MLRKCLRRSRKNSLSWCTIKVAASAMPLANLFLIRKQPSRSCSRCQYQKLTPIYKKNSIKEHQRCQLKAPVPLLKTWKWEPKWNNSRKHNNRIRISTWLNLLPPLQLRLLWLNKVAWCSTKYTKLSLKIVSYLMISLSYRQSDNIMVNSFSWPHSKLVAREISQM
jgi:hypothetical protein